MMARCKDIDRLSDSRKRAILDIVEKVSMSGIYLAEAEERANLLAQSVVCRPEILGPPLWLFGALVLCN